MTTGHFIEGLKFMLVPDFSKLNVEGVLMALGQAFFSLSLGTIFSFNIWNFSIRYLATLGIFMIFLNAIGIFK